MIAALALFVSLGLDTLAVALGLGVKGLPKSRWWRVGLTFALFEGLMPVIGLVLGRHLSGAMGDVAGYAAGAILVVLGALEIREALGDDDAQPLGWDSGDTRAMLLAGLSVSLDELAIGFALGVLHVAVGPALLYIGAQAFVLTFLGLWAGARVGAKLGERAELVAGGLLVLLGVALLIGQATGRHWI